MPQNVHVLVLRDTAFSEAKIDNLELPPLYQSAWDGEGIRDGMCDGVCDGVMLCDDVWHDGAIVCASVRVRVMV